MTQIQRSRRSRDTGSYRILLTFYATLIAVLLMCGCMSPQKAVSYLKKHDLLADTCAANFPVKDSIITRETVRFDTIDITPEQPIDIDQEESSSPNCPPCKPKVIQVTKTVTKDTTIIRRDEALVQSLASKVNRQQSEIDARDQTIRDLREEVIDQKEKVARKNRRLFWMYVIIGALVVLLFRKPILRLTGILPV